MNEDAQVIAYVEISNEFGESTAELYKQYFKTKKPDEIINSLNDLLLEALGPKKTEEKMKHIKNVLKVYVAIDL